MTPAVFVLFVAALTVTSSPVPSSPVDCNDVFHLNRTNPSGIYTIYPSDPRFGIPVYCDADTEGGPWTVILRRMDGSENFYRPWTQYVSGFGTIEKEYWLGLEFIHKITLNSPQKLLVEMEDFDGRQTSAVYSSFSVSSDCDGYRLAVSGFINRGAGDGLSYHSGARFSTFDKDHDTYRYSCAKSHMSGFWFKTCLHSNPTGVYLWGSGAEGAPAHTGVFWNTFRGQTYSVKSISFKIHPA